jgi:hypothetical protein
MSKPEDIRRYLPDAATAMKAADEKAAADRHRKALESAPPPVPVVAAPPVTAPIEPAASGRPARHWTPSKRTAAVLAVLGVAIPVLIQAFLHARTPVVAESRPPTPSASALGGPPSPSSLPLPSPSPIRSVEPLPPSPSPTVVPILPTATAAPTVTPSAAPRTAPKPPKPTGPIAPPPSSATSAPTPPPPPPDPKFVE